MTQPRFPRVALDVPAEVADDVAFELFDLGARGVEQRDDTTLDAAVQQGGVLLLASFASDHEADSACSVLDPSFNPRRDDVVGDAWRDGWKEHFRPFALTPRIVIRPPWMEAEAAPGGFVLVMDPGRAFGTGLHATTRLVAQAIERNAARLAGRQVLDVGCGSGVLALCALVHGAAVVRAVDNDPEAVSATRENAQRNGFASRVDADTKDVRAMDRSFPFVVANIETRVLVPMAESLCRCVEPGGTLVLSGILQDQVGSILEAYAPLRHLETFEDGGWVALAFRAEA